MNSNHFKVITQTTDYKTPKQKNRKVYKLSIRSFGMENKTKQTTDKNREVEITLTNYKNLGCGCEIEENGIKFNCGNLINGFAYFCRECNKKKELRR
jgi:hypothetical protein